MPKKTENEIGKPGRLLFGGLALLLVASLLVGYLVPEVPNSTKSIFSSLNSVQLRQIIALVLIAALTVIFLSYYRAKFFFSSRWLAAAIIYNSLIIFVKYTISTNQYTNQHVDSFGRVLSTALLVSLLYIFGFFVLYLFFDGKLLNRSLHKSLVVSTDGKVLLAMGLFVLVTLARVIAFRLPILSGTAASSYLGDVFKSNAVLLNILLFVMIIAAVEAYAQVRRKIDLKYFLISGLSMILIFHITWALFIFRSFR